jgi:hypothetical protein
VWVRIRGEKPLSCSDPLVRRNQIKLVGRFFVKERALVRVSAAPVFHLAWNSKEPTCPYTLLARSILVQIGATQNEVIAILLLLRFRESPPFTEEERLEFFREIMPQVTLKMSCGRRKIGRIQHPEKEDNRIESKKG